MGVFIAAGTRGGQFGETRFPDGRASGRAGGELEWFSRPFMGRGTRAVAVGGEHVRM